MHSLEAKKRRRRCLGWRWQRGEPHSSSLGPRARESLALDEFDPSLMQLLDTMRLEEHAVNMREKARKRFVDMAVRIIAQQLQKTGSGSGEPDIKDNRVAALYAAGAHSREAIEASVGPGEPELAEGLLENADLSLTMEVQPTSHLRARTSRTVLQSLYGCLPKQHFEFTEGAAWQEWLSKNACGLHDNASIGARIQCSYSS